MKFAIVHIVQCTLLIVVIGGMCCCGCGRKSRTVEGTKDSHKMAPKAGGMYYNKAARDLSSSILGSDLVSGHRELVYRAWSYLRRAEIPGIPGPKAKSPEEWAAYGRELEIWLGELKSQLVSELIEGYPAFVRTWSPYYLD